MVKDYHQDAPTWHRRQHAMDWEISTREPWAYALALSEGGGGGGAPTLTFDATPSPGWSVLRPFSTDEYPFSIRAAARKLPETTWGYWAGSKITAQPGRRLTPSTPPRMQPTSRAFTSSPSAAPTFAFRSSLGPACSLSPDSSVRRAALEHDWNKNSMTLRLNARRETEIEMGREGERWLSRIK